MLADLHSFRALAARLPQHQSSSLRISYSGSISASEAVSKVLRAVVLFFASAQVARPTLGPMNLLNDALFAIGCKTQLHHAMLEAQEPLRPCNLFFKLGSSIAS